MREVKRNFKIALSSAGLSMSDFARKIGVSPQAVHQTMSGMTTSKKLRAAIDSFIKCELHKLKISMESTKTLRPDAGSRKAPGR